MSSPTFTGRIWHRIVEKLSDWSSPQRAAKPLRRLRIGLLLLGGVIFTAIVGYRLSGLSIIDSVWMVAITLSSVGYGEVSDSDPWFKVFTVMVIVFGMSATAYAFGGFLQMITEGEIQRVLGKQRMTNKIDLLEKHVVICGFGRNGHLLAESLASQNQSFVIVDNDPALVAEAAELGYLVIEGDATEDDVLIETGIERARSLVTTLPNDAENVFITLTTRNICPGIQIIARAEHQTSEKKLRQAGANKIVMPAVIGAHQMARMITRPSTADLMELVAESTVIDVDLDEINVQPGSKLIGLTVRETEAHRLHRILVVAIKQLDGNMIFNPGADYHFSEGDIMIVMGQTDDIKSFYKAHGITR